MGRKGSGIEVRGNAIRIQFSIDGEVHRHTLKRNGESIPPTPANLNYAERLAAEIRERVKAGKFSFCDYFPATGKSGLPLTVGEQLDAWLSVQRLEASTKAGYTSGVQFWKDAACSGQRARLGERPISQLKSSHVLAALAARPDLTGKTINNYVSVLRRAMDLAVADKALNDNPVDAVKPAKHQRPPPDPFSREEAEAILADMVRHYPAPIANYVEFKFFTGLRTSESFGLYWSDIDLSARQAQIKRAIVRGLEKDSTKTHTVRLVTLNSRSLAALQRQRAHTQLAGVHVFLDPRYGTPWFEERAFRRSYWEPSLKRLSLRYRPPYNTRHTYATMMLMAGMTPGFCAKQLGHSVEVFLETYARWVDGDRNLLEMQRLESSLAADSLDPLIGTRAVS